MRTAELYPACPAAQEPTDEDRWMTVPPTLPFTGLEPVEVFAVEDSAAQLVWRELPRGDVGVVVRGHDRVVGEGGRPGAGEITGLTAGATNVVDVTIDSRVIATREIRTTPSLAGPGLTRIATISDLHLGEEGFGLFKEMREAGHHDRAYPLRCAKAAIAEATEWGAELLVIKGDITDLGQPGHWEQFDELLDAATIPIVAIPGNHDTFRKPGSLDAAEELRRRGLFPDEIQTIDLPGVRVVAVDTTTPRHSWGRIEHLSESLCTAVDTQDPVLLLLHHHLETHHYPRFWPLGTPKRQAGHVLDALVDANPDLLISSGHTHRNRSRTHRSAVITEVGATKDHPGVWAGYIAHDGGIRQVVRRVADPTCIAWNDRTHAAVGGIWGRWSPGRLDQRSFVHPWGRNTESAAARPLAATMEA
jgi:predicted MPP superfamily phosphohydrolase